jgi:hypothetical protein
MSPADAAKLFRIVSFVMALNDERTDFVVPALELAEWLEKYDRWFKQASGIEQGRNLHLLYNRTSSINCAGILRTADTLPALLRAATRTGIQLRVSTVLSECVELEPQLNKLLDAGLNSISLYFDREDVAGAEAEACRHLMENLASRSINLLLIGYISGWERIGVLSSKTMMAQTFHLAPARSALAQRNRQSHAFDPCANRLQLYIDSVGRIYPCVGLAGLDAASLGSIYDPIEETVLNGHPASMDFNHLARVGPGQMSGDASTSPALNGTCALHRAVVSQVSARPPTPRTQEMPESC